MENLLEILPKKITGALEKLTPLQIKEITELRLRIGKPICIFLNNKEYFLSEHGLSNLFGLEFEKTDAEFFWRRLCDGAPYSFTANQRFGYITVGGNRVGFCGDYAIVENEVKHINQVSSFCIRVAHEIKNCARPVYKYLFDNNVPLNTLIVSPPGNGKTTLLRDLVRLFSVDGFNVAVVDEREEIGGLCRGQPVLDLGLRTDCLGKISKKHAINNLLRSMAPDIIAVDELGTQEDIVTVNKAIYQGVALLATAHGKNENDAKKIDVPFDRYIILSSDKIGMVDKILDIDFKVIKGTVCS